MARSCLLNSTRAVEMELQGKRGLAENHNMDKKGASGSDHHSHIGFNIAPNQNGVA